MENKTITTCTAYCLLFWYVKQSGTIFQTVVCPVIIKNDNFTYVNFSIITAETTSILLITLEMEG